jgi:hypothetical protein
VNPGADFGTYINIARYPRIRAGGAAGSGVEMPLLRYFVVVGGALLALLFISDAVLPKQPLPSFLSVASSDLPPVRIHSERKWPERIVFDTSMPAIKPALMAEAQTAPPATPAPKARVREAFAQFTPPVSKAEVKADVKAATKIEARIDVKTDVRSDQSVTKVAETGVQPKRKVAKPRQSRPLMLVAQQPHVGWFDSTW